ncbi:hypothetical protein [Streptomyces chrestomyceticus]|uniref:hypothetical protein n=1 Tax=Streptomyces chrestomyceticus TaxID=68185 RepID=UPI0033F115DD
MSFTWTLRVVNGAVLVGALVLGTASAASADCIRDGQWALGAFGSGAIDLDEKKAISYALAKDVLLVAATGNAGASAPQYPAAAPGVPPGQ